MSFLRTYSYLVADLGHKFCSQDSIFSKINWLYIYIYIYIPSESSHITEHMGVDGEGITGQKPLPFCIWVAVKVLITHCVVWRNLSKFSESGFSQIKYG